MVLVLPLNQPFHLFIIQPIFTTTFLSVGYHKLSLFQIVDLTLTTQEVSFLKYIIWETYCGQQVLLMYQIQLFLLQETMPTQFQLISVMDVWLVMMWKFWSMHLIIQHLIQFLQYVLVEIFFYLKFLLRVTLEVGLLQSTILRQRNILSLLTSVSVLLSSL